VPQEIALNFEVARNNLRETRFVESPVPAAADLASGEVVLAVSDFAFTANNITYGVLGESLSYFSFFPAGEGWGRIPVWGYGEVAVSKNADVPVGTRVFGYFPMSSHVTMKAQSTKGGFADAAAHRAALPPIYNSYSFAPKANADLEARLALFRPLFATAYLLDDWLAEQRFFGARRILLTSASGKTAFSLAAILARRTDRPTIVGLTSKINESFVRSLGVYDKVVLYDEVGSLPLEASVSVDMAGSEATLLKIHERLAEHLVYSCRVGASHWEQRGDFMGKQDWPGRTPEFFFAPSRAQELSARIGPLELQSSIKASLEQFLTETSGGWLKIVRTHARDIEAIYRATLEGRVPPDVGNILSLR
jgi:hypothetical protein